MLFNGFHRDWLDGWKNVAGEWEIADEVEIGDLSHKNIYCPKGPCKWAAWVDLWRVGKSKFMLSFSHRSGKPVKLKSKKILLESNNGGKTWKKSDIPPPPGSVIQLSDSKTLVCIAWGRPLGTINFFRSTDAGMTWKGPVSINDPETSGWWPTRIRELSDGRLVIGCYGHEGRLPPEQARRWCSAAIFVSHDSGGSWHGPLIVARPQDDVTFHEPAFVELPNGDLFFVLRAHRMYHEYLEEDLCRFKVTLTKHGDTWIPGAPAQTFIPQWSGHPELLLTQDGTLICACSDHVFAFSCDHGRHWSGTYRLHAGGRGDSHYPRLVEVEQGHILSIYHIGYDWPYPPPKDMWIQSTSFSLKKVRTYAQSDPFVELAVSFAGEEKWRDCTIETRAKFEKSGGIVFRATDNGAPRFYAFYLDLSHVQNEHGHTMQTTCTFAKHNGNTLTPLKTSVLGGTIGDPVATPGFRSPWHSLKVVVKGDLIQGYVDGELLIRLRDASFSEGRVGIMTRYSRAWFSRFMLS